jgi:CBS domain-containing protein
VPAGPPAAPGDAATAECARRDQLPTAHSIRGPYSLTQILRAARTHPSQFARSAMGTVLAPKKIMRVHFDEPVVAYMTRDLEVAHVDTPVDKIARTMHMRDVSGVPILDARGRLVGVVTRTDLIRLGLVEVRRGSARSAMPLPQQRASDVMTHAPVEVGSSMSLRHAARLMIDNEIHRVFVTEGGQIAGVISAVDLAAAVRDAKLAAPVSSIMTSPITTIDVHQPLSTALDVLDRRHVTGLIVTEEDQPIGMFAQADALASRELPGPSSIEDVYDPAVICLPHDMKLHRVAAHVTGLRVRRVVVCKAREAVGVVSASDFARIVALS